MEIVREKSLVLIVDDERFMRSILRDALEDGGYAVLEAESAPAAFRLLQQDLPDIVLLDLVMPDMDGFAACIEMRRNPATRHLPILVVTGLEDPETINRAYAVGATDYISKPINGTYLCHHVRYILRANRLLEDLRRKEEKLLLAGKVFNHSSEIIMITDPGARVLDINPAFTLTTGYRREEILHRDFQMLIAEPGGGPFLTEDFLRTGIWQGEISCRRKNGEIFPALLSVNAVRNKEGQVTHYVGIATDVSRVKETERRLKYLASYDPLTDLPNRLMFHEELQQALVNAQQQKETVGVMLCDLDNFKEINDTLGPLAGDHALQILAKRLQGCVRHSDMVARVGGDEFGIILNHLNQSENGNLVGQRIADALAEPFILEGGEVFIGLSIGITIFPDDGGIADHLIKNAETAMHFTKQNGKNGYQFFAEKMNSRNRERLALKTELRRGLERDEFILHYQAKFNSRTGALTGLEALVRWQHPERGLVPPMAFIPLAEETGLILPLGDKVLRMACAQARNWQSRGFSPCRIAVNLSANQFRAANLTEEISRTLQETGLDPCLLELEITESAIMEDAENAARTLLKLKEMGIRIALDDFGTGYSSLSYLKRFPVDSLKIDYSFVKNILQNSEDTAIVRAIIAIARSLNLTVIAEGVETEEQRAFLLEHGCDELQGYVAGMPKAAAEVEQFLRRLAPDKIILCASAFPG